MIAWVGLAGNGSTRVVRIFRNKKAAFLSGEVIVPYERALAVAEIRHQIFLRSQGNCEACGCPVNESTAHMHEKVHRGRGGEISLENSLFICAACHKWAHRARNPQWRQL
jgi:5-methylcytosine-specific restriction endonuclease McrA